MTVTPAGVLAVGATLPSFAVRVADIAAAWGDAPRGDATLAVCAPDEDTLTLAWGAATTALAAAGLTADDVDGLWWGTTRAPFAEGPSHAFLAAAVGLREDALGALSTGSTHAGMDALLAAWDAVGAGTATTALVVTSDAVVPGLGTALERRATAGAAAFVLTRDAASTPARLTGRVTRSVPVLDRYRGDGESATRDLYDGRLFREEVFVPLASALTEEIAASVKVADWAITEPDGRMGKAVARSAGAAGLNLGDDAGAAGPFLDILRATASPGAAYGVLAYGGGRATAVALSVDAPIPGGCRTPPQTLVTYGQALRARGQLVPSGETVPMGVPPASAAFVRGNREILGLLGARCVDCATVSTPPSIHPTCTGCGGGKLETVPLARRGVVHTFVVNQTMPAPFVAPLPLAVVDLDDGARVMLQVTGGAAGLDVGTRVELVLRRYAVERGAPVYGFKAEVEGVDQ